MAILLMLLGLIFVAFSGLVMGAALSCFFIWNSPGWGIILVIIWLLCD